MGTTEILDAAEEVLAGDTMFVCPDCEYKLFLSNSATVVRLKRYQHVYCPGCKRNICPITRLDRALGGGPRFETAAAKARKLKACEWLLLEVAEERLRRARIAPILRPYTPEVCTHCLTVTLVYGSHSSACASCGSVLLGLEALVEFVEELRDGH
jgi:hypothetical protein